jgi:hypothetical protein
VALLEVSKFVVINYRIKFSQSKKYQAFVGLGYNKSVLREKPSL